MHNNDSDRTYTFIAYGLAALPLFGLIPVFIAMILAYTKRSELQGSIYHSHLNNIIRSSWIMLFGTFISIILTYLIIGFFTGLIVLAWYYYRLIKGALKLKDNHPYA